MGLSSWSLDHIAFSWRVIPKAFRIKDPWESWNYQGNVEGRLFVEPDPVLRRALEGDAALVVGFEHEGRDAIGHAVGGMLDAENFHRIGQPLLRFRVQEDVAGNGARAKLADLAQQLQLHNIARRFGRLARAPPPDGVRETASLPPGGILPG